MDVEGKIRPGDDFTKVLINQVEVSDVLLVVIGPRWADLMSERASDETDFVAIEIRAAIDKDKYLLPILVGGAAMPSAERLPEVIRALAKRHAVSLRPDRFKTDCQSLVQILRKQLTAIESENDAREKLTAAAVEAEIRKKNDQEAIRIASSIKREATKVREELAKSLSGLPLLEIEYFKRGVAKEIGERLKEPNSLSKDVLEARRAIAAVMLDCVRMAEQNAQTSSGLDRDKRPEFDRLMMEASELGGEVAAASAFQSAEFAAISTGLDSDFTAVDSGLEDVFLETDRAELELLSQEAWTRMGIPQTLRDEASQLREKSRTE